MRTLLLISVCSAALQAFAEDSRTAEPSTKGCPDLTGTYEARIAAWADKVHPFGLRARMETRQFATFQRSSGGFTLIWHTPREEFVAAARSLAQRDSYRYDVWLDRMLRGPLRDPKLPLPPGVDDEHDLLGRIASVGPVFRGVDEVLLPKQCKGGWFLVSGPAHRDGPPDFKGGMEGTRDLEYWLGRDKDGSLILKAEEHRTLVLMKESLYTPYLGGAIEQMACFARAGPHPHPRGGAAGTQSTCQARSEVPDHRRPRGGVLPAPEGEPSSRCADRNQLVQYLPWPHAPGRDLRPDTLHGDCLSTGCRCHRQGGGLPEDRSLHPADRFAGVASSVGWTADGEVPHDGSAVRKGRAPRHAAQPPHAADRRKRCLRYFGAFRAPAAADSERWASP
jgi:hypothetical protein